MNSEQLNAEQAAAILGVSARKLYDLAAPVGPIPCFRIGRRITFDISDVLDFKESCRHIQKNIELTQIFPCPSVKIKVSPLPGEKSALEKTFASLGIVPRKFR